MEQKNYNECTFEKEFIKRCEAKYGPYTDTDGYKFISKIFKNDKLVMRKDNIVKIAKTFGECLGIRVNREHYRTLKGIIYWFQQNLDLIQNFCRGKKITLFTVSKPIIVQF